MSNLDPVLVYQVRDAQLAITGAGNVLASTDAFHWRDTGVVVAIASVGTAMSLICEGMFKRLREDKGEIGKWFRAVQEPYYAINPDIKDNNTAPKDVATLFKIAVDTNTPLEVAADELALMLILTEK